jgi:hypothetical protein
MPISQSAYTVGTALVEIVSPDIQPVRATIHNLEKVDGRLIYIGNASLVAGQSVELSPNVFLQITLDPGDSLYARTVSGDWQLGVMIQKQD